jgi:hypothetical protein
MKVRHSAGIYFAFQVAAILAGCWISRLKPYQTDGTELSSNSIESPLGKM